jgi:hypothetical protein
MAIVNPTPATAASVHIDSALSTFATKYENSGFIADRLCPIVPVAKRSDTFFKRNRRDVSHAVNDVLGPKSRANEFRYDLSTASYAVQDRGLVDYVGSTMIMNADAPLDPRELSTSALMQQILLARELRVASIFCTSGNFTNTGAVSNLWTNETTGTPIADINTAIAAIPFSGDDTSLVGYCSRPVWNALRKHPQLLALKGTTTGQVSRAEAAAYFELDELLVSNLFSDTNNIGQDASYSRGWTATVFGVVRVPKVVSTPDASVFAVTFRAQPGLQVRTWDEPAIGRGGSEAIQVEVSDDEAIIQADMGYLLTSVA